MKFQSTSMSFSHAAQSSIQSIGPARKPSFHVLLLLVLLVVPCPLSAAVTHLLEINFSFDSSAVPDKHISSYKLFASSNPVCEQAASSTPAPLVCLISLAEGTYPFTLSVAFTDGTETPQSPPFLFTLGEGTAIHDITGNNINDLEDSIQGLRTLTGRKDVELNSAADVNSDGRIGLEEVISSLRTVELTAE